MKPGAIVAEGVSRRFRVYPQRNVTLKDAILRRRQLRREEIWALRDVSLAIQPGEAVGIVGRNGSGKTTLLRLIAGIFQPTGGRLEVMVKPKLMDWQKTDIRFDNNGSVSGWTVKETWEFELQNSKDIDVVLDIRRNFAGDWHIKTEAKFEKVDANKVKFVLPLKPREKQKLGYEVTLRYGTNATR